MAQRAQKKREPVAIPAGASTWISVDQLSALLGIPKGTLYQWSSKGVGPPTYRAGRRLRYRLDQVEAWVEAAG
jgi:excisionase family DNA binding protein